MEAPQTQGRFQDQVQPEPQKFENAEPARIPESLAQLRRVDEFVKSSALGPAIARLQQKTLGVILQPQFLKDAQALQKNPRRNWVVPGVLLFYLLYWRLKKRVMVASDRIVVLALLHPPLWAIFWGGLFLVVYLILGQPFLNIMIALFS